MADQPQLARRYEALLRNSTEVVAILDANGTITYMSPAAQRVFGYTPDAMTGVPGFDFIHPDDRAEAAAAFRGCVAEGSARCLLRARHADGSWRWIEETMVNCTDEPAIGGIVVNNRDVTDRRLAEDRLAARTAQQSAVAWLGMLALETPDRDEFVRAALEVVVTALDVVHAIVFEATDDAEWVRVRASSPELERMCAGDLVRRESVAMTSYILDTGESVTVDDRRVETRFPWSKLARAWSFVSAIGAPIVANGRCHGVLALHHRQARAFTADDRSFVESVAHLLGWVNERAAYEEETRHRSLHDAATGLPNRELFCDRLDQAIVRAKRRKLPSAVLSIGLDRFQVINDSIGHANGDLVLVEVARRLEGCVRASDTVGRLSGDQFILLCEELRTPERAARIAEKIMARLSEPLVIAKREISLSASIGIAMVPASSSAEQLISEADAAMHRAKRRGHGGYELVDEALRDRAVLRLELEEGLRHAVERGELRVHYQPVVDLGCGSPVGVEALVRWQHPHQGLVAPSSFIPLAEETGLIVPMGRWVLAEACRTVAGWNRRRGDLPPLDVAVNLSTRQLADPDLVEVVAATLDETGLPAELLCLEITESFLMQSPDRGSEVLGALHRLGVRICVDDFGTGYSSLLYLRSFPVDSLKVDRIFVAGLGRNAEDTAIVRGVIALAHSLGLQVIAEGVEDRGQVEDLRALSCDLGQGFHWARPLPAGKVEALLGVRAEPARVAAS
ncbi:MAG TPA: EAL domain-containing protein [Candidatus Dormibacteraeota bacterium]|jgi:diguanylate cyclase (GGDEF)-like protein/PAS domain S-box-containing protein|nr:EAL domain-containing protein [Candidatus Dormibacteraeota bacterium]